MSKAASWGAIGVVLVSFILFAQDHPGKQVKQRSAADDVATAINDYIHKDKLLKGKFMIYDDKEDMVRQLTFEGLHTVNQLDEDSYFVCADFADDQEDKLDLDFYLDVSEKSGQLEVSKLLIHKVNGNNHLKDK